MNDATFQPGAVKHNMTLPEVGPDDFRPRQGHHKSQTHSATHEHVVLHLALPGGTLDGAPDGRP